MKRKLMVYPFNEQYCSLLRYPELLTEYQITTLVAPRGWGMEGRDAGTVDGGLPLNLLIHDQFDEGLRQAESVLFVDSNQPVLMEELILPQMEKTIAAGKEILCTIPLEEKWLAHLVARSQAQGVIFRYCGGTKSFTAPDTLEAEFIEALQTPVIFVMGFMEQTNKFEIQLALRHHLQAMGYRVSQVGTRHYCELLGFHSFPSFMFAPMLETQKVVTLNRLLKEIEREEEPDVMIIGIPGGVMPFNRTLTNRFGILAFEVSQAVEADAVVFSVPYNDYIPEFFEKISNSLKYKFNCEIDCFQMANTYLNWDASDRERQFVFTTLEANFVEKAVQQYGSMVKPIYQIQQPEAGKMMAEWLVNRLAEYAQVECM